MDMNFRHLAAALTAVAVVAASQSSAEAQERPGKVQIVRGSAAETFTPKPAGALPVVLRGKFPREPEPAAAAPAPWFMSSGSRGVWFYNAGEERLVNCWRQNTVYFEEYRVVCVRRTLTLY
jgi:hypothetical protein